MHIHGWRHIRYFLRVPKVRRRENGCKTHMPLHTAYCGKYLSSSSSLSPLCPSSSSSSSSSLSFSSFEMTLEQCSRPLDSVGKRQRIFSWKSRKRREIGNYDSNSSSSEGELFRQPARWGRVHITTVVLYCSKSCVLTQNRKIES